MNGVAYYPVTLSPFFRRPFAIFPVREETLSPFFGSHLYAACNCACEQRPTAITTVRLGIEGLEHLVQSAATHFIPPSDRATNSTERPRIVVADDLSLVAAGLAKLIEAEFDVVAIVGDGSSLIDAVGRCSANLALVDLNATAPAGVDAARIIRERNPDCKLIFLSVQARAEAIREAFRAGAAGYVLKSAAESELLTAIREVLGGKVYLSAAMANHFLSLILQPRPLQLTARQRDILRSMAIGRSAKETAALLNLSIRTIQFHKARIMERLGLHTTAELVRYSIENGIIS